MNTLKEAGNTRNEYVKPHQEIIYLKAEHLFLQSNLEPIDGGDDPDIDW